MDKLIEQVLGTGGPLGVLVIVVWIFVKAQKDRAEEHRLWLDQNQVGQREWINRLNEDHIHARDVTRNCLDKNTVAMEKNTTAMIEFAEAMRRCGFRQSEDQ